MPQVIDTSILDILRAGRCEGNRYYLPSTRLDPKTYKKANEVLANLGGKWTSGKTQAHVFDGDADEILAPTLGSGIRPVSAQKEFQAFFTPREVAEKVAGIARGATREGNRVIEPSCGDGALIAAYLETGLPAGVTIDAVEIQSKHADAARKRFAGDERVRSIVTGDILGQLLDFEAYQIVICNPPFNVTGDSLAWVTHTLYYMNTLLAPGGRLVGIVPNSLLFRDTRIIAELRREIETHGYIQDLGQGAFGKSGTEAGTVLFVYDKTQSTTTPRIERGKRMSPRQQAAQVAAVTVQHEPLHLIEYIQENQAAIDVVLKDLTAMLEQPLIVATPPAPAEGSNASPAKPQQLTLF